MECLEEGDGNKIKHLLPGMGMEMEELFSDEDVTITGAVRLVNRN